MSRIGIMTEIVPSGQGRMLTARGNVMAFKAVADQTGGDFSLMERGPARLLVLHAPAMDAYFEELHKLWSSGHAPSRETELELMSRYGMEPG